MRVVENLASDLTRSRDIKLSDAYLRHATFFVMSSIGHAKRALDQTYLQCSGGVPHQFLPQEFVLFLYALVLIEQYVEISLQPIAAEVQFCSHLCSVSR
jgi:hypothetical protein